MIGSLRGRLLDRSGDEVLVEVGGIGYRVVVTPAVARDLGTVGSEVLVHVHHHVREDAESLYGFATAEDRRVFEVLLSAHGVGPALAQAVLSVHPPAQLRRVLATGDVDALCAVPGIGKKTAARLVIDLGARLGAGDDGAPVGAGGGAPGAVTDVREALLGLGYAPDEVRRVMADLPDDGDPAELLRSALQRLAAA